MPNDPSQQTTPRLTKPQRIHLADFADHARPVCLAYKPTQKLRDIGLIEVREQRFGGHIASITAAGKEALANG